MNDDIFDSTPSLTLASQSTEVATTPDFEVTAATLEQNLQSLSADQQEALQMESLTPEQRQEVEAFAKTIDLTNSADITQYGAGSQKKIADFSEMALDKVRSKDLGQIGDMLSSMVVELQNFEKEDDEKGGLFGFFKKQKDKVSVLKNKYSSAETNINKIVDSLEGYQVTLMRDIAMLDKMYEVNKNYFKELTMYILAGKKKLEKARNEELPALIQRSKQTGLPEDVQAANDYAQMIDRFDKKIHDLELTRMIAIQMAPQIRLVQNNDTLMNEKIHSSLVNTIPLWKSQMALALGIAHSTQALEAQNAVTNMTNELLTKNSQMLKTQSIKIAEESERGIVDIDTLKQTNADLISTFDEVLQIQSNGRQKRAEAEKELKQIESDLRQKLLDLSNKQLNE